MNVKKVWGVYFSATGTTEKVVTRIAKTAAERMGAEFRTYSFSLPDIRVRPIKFTKEDFVVFGVPVYAGRIPNVLLPFIKEKVSGDGTPATQVVVYGNRSFDDALIELRGIMQANGFCSISAGAFIGEHSFSTVLGAGRPDDDDMAQAVKLGEETAIIMQNATDLSTEAAPVPGNTPVRPYYTPRDRHGNSINILKVKPKTNRLKCVNCGLCASICTMGSIDPADVSEVSGVCIKCNACVKRCPAHAKYFDDEGYIYHRQELEEMYKRRASAELYF